MHATTSPLYAICASNTWRCR
ncbi:TPA: hypothetical protein J4Z58_004686 [Escherichia coli]|nr:hypothetical protein [Escherichia coli]HBA5071892.1 hypothetical protein [Escherichia coli]